MSVQYEAILQQVLALPSKDRAKIADAVLDSLDREDTDDVRASWIQEIESRLAAIERGEAAFRDGKEVMADMRKRLLS
jgi:putative addiction module component (TIGR02574 family)